MTTEKSGQAMQDNMQLLYMTTKIVPEVVDISLHTIKTNCYKPTPYHNNFFDTGLGA